MLLSSLYRQILNRGRAARVPVSLAHIGEQLRGGDSHGARRALDAHLARFPQDADALHLRGLAELQEGRPARAVDFIAQALACAPENPAWRANLGLAHWRAGALGAARVELEAAIAAAPALPGASVNLAYVLVESGQPMAARAALTAALAHVAEMERADAARIWVTLAGLEPLLPDIDGRGCLEQAAALDPDDPWLSVQGYMSYACRCDWRFPAARLAEYFERCAVETPPAGAPILAPAIADCVAISAAARLQVARRYAGMIETAVAPLERPAVPARKAGERIRLAYLSADFHDHPTMHLLRGVLARHDHARFEVLGYSYGPDDGKGVRQEVERSFDRFFDISGEAPVAAARRIAADGVDILVDLKGYTGAARPEIVALRPAPVQVNYLGYPGTTGGSFHDYMIADAVVIPEGREGFYSESIVRMPHSYQATDDAQAPVPAALPAQRRAAGLPEDAFVFCSFNSCYKIEPEIFTVWMDILRDAPHAVLWVLADPEEARANLRREAAARGVDPGRLIFAASMPRRRHLERVGLADLFLDTHLVNAHTTASDALWAGLPVLTACGAGFSSRVAASVLRAAGLAELVCDDLAGYRALAVALASDPARMAALRGRCMRARTDSPLFDTPAYTRALEFAFAEMQRRRLAGEPPRAFNVPPSAGQRPC